ncbi:MAG: hypothetical protein NC124_12625 [Clostridium sp.]|nr:hypothetical protein [Clostridium sp.]
MSYMLIMWADTINPKFIPDFGRWTVGWQRKNQISIPDFGRRTVGGQRKNQSRKGGIICCGR